VYIFHIMSICLLHHQVAIHIINCIIIVEVLSNPYFWLPLILAFWSSKLFWRL